jgi:hypothetical protein
MSFEKLLGDFHFNHDDEESGNERVAHLKHVEVEQSVQHIGKISVALQFGKDLVSADLKQLIDVAEETLEIVVKVVAWVHQHGVEDEAVEEDKDLKEDGHDEWKGKA